MKIDTSQRPELNGGPKAENAPENPELKKVAKQFEAIFINQMIGAMRKTVPQGGLIPESNAERVFKGMLDSEHAERMADAEQMGLSRIVYEHLLRTSQRK